MNPLQPLNLPHFEFIFRNENGIVKIYDSLRRKFVALTPEEWVRQNFVAFLINDKYYPVSLMANEMSLTQNGISRRCDTMVADLHGQPLAIIEYKSPDIKITQKTFDQIVRYNMELRAKYLIVSNGLKHYCCVIDYQNKTYEFLKDIPEYSKLKP